MLVSNLLQINMKTSTWFVWQHIIQCIEGKNEQRIAHWICWQLEMWECLPNIGKDLGSVSSSKTRRNQGVGAGREKEEINLISHGNFNLLLKWLNVSEICHSDKEARFRRGRGWRQWIAEVTFHVCLLLHVSELWGLI